MNELHLGYALVGSLAVVLAAVSSRLLEVPLSEPLLGLLLGVAVGPQALGLLDLSSAERPLVLEEAARLLLAVSLMSVALRYPAQRLRRSPGRPPSSSSSGRRLYACAAQH